MTCQDVFGEIYVVVTQVIWDAVVYVVLITAVVIFFLIVFANCKTLFQSAFVEDLGAHMLETLSLHWKVRDRITAMRHSGLEMIFSVQLIEPDRKVRITNSWTSKGIELSHFDFVGQKMSDCMSGQSSS